MEQKATRFSYYKRLSAAQKKTYRDSDAVHSVALPNPRSFDECVDAVRAALESGRQRTVGNASRALVDAITRSLKIESVMVSVRDQRPSYAEGELHGYYTRPVDATPTIEVWMRTAANARVVAFKTFLRTLLHEVCHHLDFTLLKLEDSFHNQGFFRRESSLVRQLLPATRRSRPQPTIAAAPSRTPVAPRAKPEQLSFDLIRK